MLNTKKILNAILLLSLMIFTACSEEKKAVVAKVIPPLSVNTITMKKAPVPIWKQFTGMTKSSADQEIRARVPGILKKIYFKDGAFIKKGQKLFMIEQDYYIAARDSAKAKKAQDQASLRLAQADVNRYAPLVKDGLAPRATLEQYQAQESALKAVILGDDADIRTAQLQLSYTMVRAPISGKVSARRVDIGNLVGQGESTLLTTIMKVDPMYAYFSPSHNDVRLFNKYSDKKNPLAYITINGATEQLRFDGHVDFSDNTVDPMTSTISMRAIIPNPKGDILPGTFVYVNLFINDMYKFIMVPPEVIFTDQLGKFLYVVDKDNKAKRINIKTGYATRFYISVSEGLSDGDKVIVSSLVKLKPGLSVKAKDVTSTQGIDAILISNNLIPEKRKTTIKTK